MSLEINTSLQKSIDKLVASSHRGSVDDGALEAVEEWLKTDGWDVLMADLDDGLALNISSFSDFYFNDDYASSVLGIDEELITDKERLEVGRQLIDEELAECSESYVDSTHCYELIASNGSRACIACVVEVMGQSGPSCDWQGVFKDREHFYDHLKHQGCYWVPKLWGAVPDEKILAMWSK